MSRTFTCPTCHQITLHYALHLCRSCYNRQYRQHHVQYYQAYLREYRQHPTYAYQRTQYDIAHQLGN